MTDQQWQAVLDVHLTGPFRILRAAAAFLRETKKEQADAGRTRPRKIVNISSTSGTRGSAGQANYAAAKAGVVGLTKTLAREWGLQYPGKRRGLGLDRDATHPGEGGRFEDQT